MNSLGRQVLFETSLSPEDVDRYLETAFRYCERVRDSFCFENPGINPSSFEDCRLRDVNTYVEKSPVPTLGEY